MCRGTPTHWESRLISDLSESGHPAGRKAPTGFRPHLAHLISIENLSIRLPYLVIRLRLQTDNPTVNYSLHQLHPMIHRIIPPSLETQQTQRVTFGAWVDIILGVHVMIIFGACSDGSFGAR